MNTKTNTHLGKKILYACVIVMSGLILLGSLAGIIGVWVVERPLSNAAVNILSVVEHSTAILRASNARVDQTLAALQAKTAEIADASQKISQNVADKGLILVLLPENKEQQLTDVAGSVRDTYNGIRGSITQGLDLYRSINRIPFVSLPGLNEDQIGKIESSLTQIQTVAETLRSGIADFRTGVTGTIDKVDAAANQLSTEIGRVRDTLSQLDSKLATLEELSVRSQQVIPGILLAIAVILSLILTFIIYSQVELIRLYIARWRILGQLQEISSTAIATELTQEGTISLESE